MKQNTTQPVQFPEFRAELKLNILKAIREAKADGILGMSTDCLRQNTQTPRFSQGPRGTNVEWVYAEIFREVCRETPQAVVFTRGMDR